MLGLHLRTSKLSGAYFRKDSNDVKIIKFGEKDTDLAAVALYQKDIENPLLGDEEVTDALKSLN